jgi:hypothetical protein
MPATSSTELGVNSAECLQVSTICQLLAEVQHMSSSQHLVSLSLHSIEQYKVQLNSLRSKLRSHIVELQASNPLFKQIPYMGAGMEQQDCSVPATAWQRTASQDSTTGSIRSHAVLVDAEDLMQLQAAFAQVDSLLLDPRELEQQENRIEEAEALLQANMQCSSWLRALDICEQLMAEGLETQLQQQLCTELAALCAVLSPDHLAVRLQQHSLTRSSSSRQGVLPQGFMPQTVAGFAAFRRQHLQSSGQQQHSYSDTAALCRHLQQAAEGSSSFASMGSSLSAQFKLLQLLYKQSAALTDTIGSGTTKCSAVLAPLGLTWLDAAALVAPQDAPLMLRLAGISQAYDHTTEVPVAFPLSSASGAAAFTYTAKNIQQPQPQHVIEVFQTSSWLQQWQQGLQAIQAMTGAAPMPGLQAELTQGSSSSSIQTQLAAAMALAAACGAAAGCCSNAVQQLQGLVAVRTSSALLTEQQQQLVQIQFERRAAEATLTKLRQSR